MKAKTKTYKKIYTIQWQFVEYDRCQYEGWNAFMGNLISVAIFPFPFSSVTKCKIAIDLQERFNKDINMLEVDPKNYNEVWGKYISPAGLRKLARRP